MKMPKDLDQAFREFIPPFGAAGNPVDITGGEPPQTYKNTIRLGLEDDRIHALILGYWHTIVTPPMVFAELVAEVVEELRGKGIDKPVVARSEEHTTELQSLMRISYAVFCLKKNKVETQHI